jgi:hypothetical protein
MTRKVERKEHEKAFVGRVESSIESNLRLINPIVLK